MREFSRWLNGTETPLMRHSEKVPARPLYSWPSWLHPFAVCAQNLHNTPLTLRVNTHKKLCVSSKSDEDDYCSRLRSWRAYLLYLYIYIYIYIKTPAFMHGFTSSKEIWCFYRLRVNSGSVCLAAARSAQEEETGDTGRLNEHLCDLSH